MGLFTVDIRLINGGDNKGTAMPDLYISIKLLGRDIWAQTIVL